MMNYNGLQYTMGLGTLALIPLFSIGILIVLVWSLFWKGLALWHSGRQGQRVWFIVFLIVHTAGVLEIIYLFGVLKLTLASLFSSESHS